MRAWWGFGAGAVLIGAAYVADVWVGQALEDAARYFSGLGVLVIEAFVRVAVVASSLALAWLVFAGPRSRPVGLVMAIVGFYFGLLPTLSMALISETAQLPPLVWEVIQHWSTGFVEWTAIAVMVLGVVELVRPTPEANQVRPMAAPVGGQP